MLFGTELRFQRGVMVSIDKDGTHGQGPKSSYRRSQDLDI